MSIEQSRQCCTAAPSHLVDEQLVGVVEILRRHPHPLQWLHT